MSEQEKSGLLVYRDVLERQIKILREIGASQETIRLAESCLPNTIVRPAPEPQTGCPGHKPGDIGCGGDVIRASEPQTAAETEPEIPSIYEQMTLLWDRIATLEKAARGLFSALAEQPLSPNAVRDPAVAALRAALSGERGCPHRFVEATLHGQSVVMCEDCGERPEIRHDHEIHCPACDANRAMTPEKLLEMLSGERPAQPKEGL